MTDSLGAMALRKWMAERGMTQIEAAHLFRCAQPAICNYLQGRAPTIAIAARIERATGIPIGDWAIELPQDHVG